jgi:hypothetical protein
MGVSLRLIWLLVTVLLIGSSVFLSGMTQELPMPEPGAVNCSFLQRPEGFFYSPEARQRELSAWTDRVRGAGAPDVIRYGMNAAVPITPRRNFIDDYIFGRMERDGVMPAPPANDQEYQRRVMLDLTGRIPSPQEVRSFAYDTNPSKYDALVESLVGSPEYIDKWTTFFADLFKVNSQATNVVRYQQGRDAFLAYIREALTLNKPYHQIAHELIRGAGDTFVDGTSNFAVGGIVPMGPVQDTYDGQAVDVAQMFLGINVVDCLLCHDGDRHLDTVNLWGKNQTRMGAWGLSAFFARTRMARQVVSQTPLYAKFMVSDAATGDYMLNTTTGNRSARQPQGGMNRVLPVYPFTGEAARSDVIRRHALAEMVVWDPQFARAIVNYVWEELMVQAFVSPSNGFDLARLDPRNPPPAPWTLQPTNPELLDALSQWFRDNNFDIRLLTILITKSNAYRLSSVYPGEWRPEYVPYYARRFVRRLDAEEIHDAVVKATGILPSYTLDYTGSSYPLPPVSWAMQLPEPREPRTNGASLQFLNAFGRGDRDQSKRDSSPSMLQALNMMNHAFVMGRIHVANSGSTVQRMFRQTTDPLAIIEELYLSTLGRYPYPPEITVSVDVMRRLGNQRGAESLQWALLNKLEFLFNY